MKAVRIVRFGGVDVLNVEEHDLPQCGPGQALIKVKSVGINPVDTLIRQGLLPHKLLQSLPLTPGWEFSGIIERIGENVCNWPVGTKVFGHCQIGIDGACAEYVLAPENCLALIPDKLTFEQAASIPIGALTAWDALVLTADVQPNERVLIHAAAGGVGTFAVQVAKNLGAYVIVTTSRKNFDYVKSLGADEAVDYEHERFETRVHDVDVVIDLVGDDYVVRSLTTLKDRGKYIAVAAPIPSTINTNRLKLARFISVAPSGTNLEKIRGLVNAGRIRPHVSAVFALEEIKTAHSLIEKRKTRGKLVLAL